MLCDMGHNMFIADNKISFYVSLLKKLQKIDMFGHFLLMKLFKRWKGLIKYKYYQNNRMLI
jgi:hypothetical protein